MIKEGKLYYDGMNDRYGLRSYDGNEYGGFHCGETLEVLIGGEWIPTRFEYSDNGTWYFVGLDISPEQVRTQGFTVRI